MLDEVSEKIINCAIYTRKSTEEGLDQNFNSLDNQYEFCSNYLKSLNDPCLHLLPTHYDDGGYSGGSLNRPALQRLLEDIRCGLVNRIIVYRLDRLTRELRDFSSFLIFLKNITSSLFRSRKTNIITPPRPLAA